MELKNIRVFVCVPGVGKTYLQKMDNRFVDMDAKRALYKYGETDESGLEKSKGNRGARRALSGIRQSTRKYWMTFWL